MTDGDELKASVIARISAHHAALYRAIFSSNPRAWLELDLTMQQLKVLFVLRFQGRHTITTLAEKFSVKLPTVTGVVDRLVEHGLVQREADAGDRRVVWVRLSDAGERMIDELHAANVSTMNQLLPRLSLHELESLETGLQALKGAFEATAVPSVGRRLPPPPLVAAAATAPRDELSGG